MIVELIRISHAHDQQINWLDHEIDTNKVKVVYLSIFFFIANSNRFLRAWTVLRGMHKKKTQKDTWRAQTAAKDKSRLFYVI